jgi:general secretion pathway protein A
MMKFSDFGFKENPFSITPDPRYLFLSRGHEESLAHLIYGTGPNGGFVQLTGEVGTGKTMLVRSLLAQKLKDVDIALILNPRLSRRDFMAAICDELGVKYTGSNPSLKEITDALTRHLLQIYSQGRHTVLVVDEAQNLSPQVLEQVRLLTNLETSRHKLLRIILVGQPELKQLLAREDLRQVDQRITARYHLSPMCRTETAQYVRHRLAVAGIQGDLFTPMALRLIHRLTGGVPRLINTLCERALLAVFATGASRVSLGLVWRAWREIRGQQRGGGIWRIAVGSGLLLGVAIAAGWWLLPGLEGEPGLSPARPSSALISGSIQRPSAALSPSETAVAAPEPASPTPYQKLFSLWRQEVGTEVEENPCGHALGRGLRCVRGVTDWKGVARLNRPMLLRLSSGEGERQLLLSGLHGSRLLVADASGEREIERAEIAGQWQGDFFLLWRPSMGEAIVGPGSRGEAVTWLRERLALSQGETAPRVFGVDHFDDDLRARLQDFQRRQGLHDDGVAGPQTLIALNNLRLDPDIPTLTGGR